MKYSLIELPDDFEKGQCLNCPFIYYDDYVGDDRCILFGQCDKCFLEIKEEKKDEVKRS